jgi:integrase
MSWGQRSWVQIPPAPPHHEPTPVSEIATFAFYLKKNGYRDSTVRSTVATLKALANKVNLLEPESVKAYLANAEHISINRKGKISEDLDRFYKYKQISWLKPHYKRVDILPFVPTTQEVNDLIASLGPKTSIFTLLLKETGCRFNEGFNLRWQDINPETSTVTITPLKGSNARQLKISQRLIGLLSGLRKKWPTYIFRNPKIDPWKSSRRFRNEYMFQRRRAATKLNQPRLNLISFKSLRHYYACRLYESTKDILFVQRQIGHRSLANTVRYTRMVNFDADGEYIVKAAMTKSEAQPLIEAGYQYVVTTPEGYMLFRKRK